MFAVAAYFAASVVVALAEARWVEEVVAIALAALLAVGVAVGAERWTRRDVAEREELLFRVATVIAMVGLAANAVADAIVEPQEDEWLLVALVVGGSTLLAVAHLRELLSRRRARRR